MARGKRGRTTTRREPLHSSSRQHLLPSHPTPHHQNHRTHHLLYLITFLLIILVLVVFFSFPFTYSPDSSEQQTSPTYTLTIDALSCLWATDHFDICETVSWGGPDVLFAKGYIAGGESLDMSSPQTLSPYTYCQPVGTEEGYHIARALLYTETGLVRDIGQGVACLGKTYPSQPKPVSQLQEYKTITGFRTFSQFQNPTFPRGNDIFTKTFPDKVQSCTFAGTWITDNNQKFSLRSSCHGAQGTFTGYADATTQYVINDPDLFRWAGTSRALINPPAERHDGYSLWMETCDSDAYTSSHKSRYGVQGMLSGFGTNTLTYSWNYFDQNNHPAVDFTIELTCQIKPSMA